MNFFAVFLQMLPLIVFIVIDSIINNTVFSIIAAILFAAIQMIVTYFIIKKIDYFILFDTALIILMGVISIIFQNEFFFKIKPALIEGIFCIYIIVMLFLPERILVNYFSRAIGGMKINPVALPKMKKMLITLIIYIILHIAAIIYTALYSSKKIWAIVSGPGLYIIFIPIVLSILIKKIFNRKNYNQRKQNDSQAKSSILYTSQLYPHPSRFISSLNPKQTIHLDSKANNINDDLKKL